MTANRVQAPPTNLKERIAAFQQRYGTQNQLQPGPSPTGSPTLNSSTGPHGAGLHSAGLRDKIAKFEQKGGVPVPRGSFGLGAPPVAENGQAKRRGELYGNRIPGVVRASGGTPSRSGSPLPSPGARSASASGFYFDGPTGADASPTLSVSASSSSHDLLAAPPSPESPRVYSPAPRRSSFAAALSVARRAASASDAIGRYDPREASASPPAIVAALPPVFAEDEPDALVSPQEDDVVPSGDTDVLSAEEIVVPSDTPESPIVAEQRPVSPQEAPNLTPVENGVIKDTLPLDDVSVETEEPVKMEEPVKTEEPTAVTIPSALASPAVDMAPTPIVPALEITVESFGPDNALSPTIINESLLVVEEPMPMLPSQPAVVLPDPPTPISAGLLSPESVFDYYQYLENDGAGEPQEPELGLVTPPPASPITVRTPSIRLSPKSPGRLSLPSSGSASVETFQNTRQRKNTSPSPSPSERSPKTAPPSPAAEAGRGADDKREMWVKVDEPPSRLDAPPSAPGNPDVLSPYSISDYFTSTPPPSAFMSPQIPIGVESPPFSPSSSYIVASPSLLTPDSSDMPRATFVRGPVKRQTSNRPISMIETSARRSPARATPDAPPVVTSPKSPEGEFGTVSMHGHARSQSHSQTGLSFSAVVHRKVAVAPAPSSSSLEKAPPATPDRSRRANKPEAPMSPGYGDLATLLEEAALLEQRLLDGDVHDEDLSSPPEPGAPTGGYQERMKLARAKSSTGVSPERGRPSLHRTSTSLSMHASPLRSSSRNRSREPAMPPPTGALPSIPGARAGEPQYRRGSVDGSAPVPPAKSPFPRYIASLRRLASSASSRSAAAVPGYPRHSASTSSELSSEDSIATPPDHSVEFGGVEHRVFPGSGSGLGVGAWPMGSPKKNGSLTRVSSRASSFAEKLWNNRKRTKSITSSIDTCGDSVTDEYTPRQLTPIIVPPASHHTVPPLRSSSLIPDGGSPRPPSWVSLETASPIASPLFDEEIVDAFPSVPQDTPALAPGHRPNRPALAFLHSAPPPPPDSQATTPTDVQFNVKHLTPSNPMPLRPRMNSMKKAMAERA